MLFSNDEDSIEDQKVEEVEEMDEDESMDELYKRQLINDANTIADVEITKRFKDAIPVAR